MQCIKREEGKERHVFVVATCDTKLQSVCSERKSVFSAKRRAISRRYAANGRKLVRVPTECTMWMWESPGMRVVHQVRWVARGYRPRQILEI